MTPRSLQDVSVASWQWQGPLKSFLLIVVIVVWGYLLRACGEDPSYTPKLQQLMSLGSFIVAIIFGILAQMTFSHMFSYIQGFFLLRKQGIPFKAIIIGEPTPYQVLTACFTILKQKSNNTENYKRQECIKISQVIL